MSLGSPSETHGPLADRGERLESWKAIADFFGKTVTTVQRWEQAEGLPVYRLGHTKKGSVFAYTKELEEWRLRRTQGPRERTDQTDSSLPSSLPPESLKDPEPDIKPQRRRRFGRRLGLVKATAVVVGVLTFTITGIFWMAARDRLTRTAYGILDLKGAAPQAPKHLVAVSRFPGSVSLSWTDDSSTETRFEIREFDDVVRTTAANVRTAEFTGLDAGRSYHWDVRACNARGCSPWHGVEGETPTGEDGPSPARPGAVGGATDIVFPRVSENGKLQIHVMRETDGWIPIRLTDTSTNEVAAAWSPDRTKIAFESDRTGFAEIFLMNADGSNQINLTNMDPARDKKPTWSPDGTRIAFASNRTSDYDIWVMAVDGSHPINLTKTPGTDWLPAWSPDGTRIAFVSDRSGSEQIYVMQTDGSKQTSLTSPEAKSDWPAWSPNGQRIAYRSRREGNSEIYVVDADGARQTRLTNHAAEDETPTWSPDGMHIAFRSNRDGAYELFSMTPNGSELIKLTHYGATDREPDWGRPMPSRILTRPESKENRLK